MVIVKRSITFTASVVALFYLMQFAATISSAATLCLPRHPQDAVCKASFVLKAKVVDTDWVPDEELQSKTSSRSNVFRQKIIRVEVRKVLKGRDVVNATKHSQLSILYTSIASTDLKVGQTYALTGWNFGRVLMMGLCDWHSIWDEMSPTQKLGIEKSFYRMFCACKIKNCFGFSCNLSQKSVRSCTLPIVESECRSKSNICVGWKGQCQWMNPGNRDQKACL
eukprot:gene5542-6227_t